MRACAADRDQEEQESEDRAQETPLTSRHAVAGAETVLHQDRLPFLAQDEVGEQGRRHRRVLQHDHPIVRRHIQLRRDLHDLQARHLLLRQDGIGAVGQEHVGLAARHDPAVLVLARRRLLGGRPARELQRLALERRAGAGLARLGLGEQREGIVAGRVGLGRRRAEAHRRIEQGVEQRRRRDLETLAGQRAQLIAREDGDLGLGEAGIGQLGGMAHVGGRKDVRRLALLDALAQQAGGGELHLDLEPAALGLERRATSVSAALRLPAA